MTEKQSVRIKTLESTIKKLKDNSKDNNQTKGTRSTSPKPKKFQKRETARGNNKQQCSRSTTPTRQEDPFARHIVPTINQIVGAAPNQNQTGDNQHHH
mmetsp:Transcript_36770/g.51956  ORF Transcript_36770/g.51956 Transcript_36770/m.51956 type:complete len:98 (+) Transcript_36770:513-806(+)